MAGITTIYAIPHDFNHILRNLSLKPILNAISVNEIMPVVTTPIINAKAILFFISSFSYYFFLEISFPPLFGLMSNKKLPGSKFLLKIPTPPEKENKNY
jgi:hypothetical protein